MSEKKNLSIERKLTNQTVIAMFIFCLPTIHNAIGQYPPLLNSSSKLRSTRRFVIMEKTPILLF